MWLGADITCADITCADVTCADVTCADVTCADVTCADITENYSNCSHVLVLCRLLTDGEH